MTFKSVSIRKINSSVLNPEHEPPVDLWERVVLQSIKMSKVNNTTFKLRDIICVMSLISHKTAI